MSRMRKDYKLVGVKKRGYAVVHKSGGIEYDLLETRELAVVIRDVLNAGIGPEWDAVSAELETRGWHSEGKPI